MSIIGESFAEWKQRIFFDHGFLREIYPNIWKIDNDLYRSAQPSPKLFQKFKKQGIRTVINLRGSREDLVDQMERRVCKNLNLNLIEFKLHSRGAPTIDQIFLSKKLFGEIEYPALIHCKSGADRTGLMATLYLINKGIDVDEAKKQLSFKYLHIRLAKSGILDHFFESFHWGNHALIIGGTRLGVRGTAAPELHNTILYQASKNPKGKRGWGKM